MCSRILQRASAFESDKQLLNDTMVSYGVTHMHELGEHLLHDMKMWDAVIQDLLFWRVSFRTLFRLIQKIVHAKATDATRMVIHHLPTDDAALDCV